jgi:hypothetical protein
MAFAQRKPQVIPGTVGTDGLTWNQFNVVADIQADLLANDKLSGAIEIGLLIWIWRATWANLEVAPGDRAEAYAAPASCAKLAKQLNTTADLVFRAIKRLRSKEVGIIATDPKDANGGKPLRLKLTPENWHKAPRYVPAGLQLVELPAAEETPEPDDPQEILPGMEHLFASPNKPAIIGVSRQVGQVRIETAGFLDVRTRWERADLVVRIEGRSGASKGDAAQTSDLQVGGRAIRHKSTLDLQVGGQIASNTPQVEIETLRAGLKCDKALAIRLEAKLRKRKESAADFVAFVAQKNQAKRKSPIQGGLLVTVCDEFLETPAGERDLGSDDETYQRDYDLAMKGDNEAAERCLKRRAR